MSLDRFKTAQALAYSGYDAAVAELQAGRKTGHWIWYIFPQFEGLGRSSTAREYALRDVQEAIDYLRDPLLRTRLEHVTKIVAEQLKTGARLTELMGGELDAMKLTSSLTLFEIAARELGRDNPPSDLADFAANCSTVLTSAEEQGLSRCKFTLAKSTIH